MSSEHLKLVISGEFPFPIAYWFRRTVDDGESRELACSLLQATLELIGSTLVCDYLSLEDQSPELDAEVAHLFDSPPSCGVWLGWTLRFLEWSRKRGRAPFLPALDGLLDRHLERELAKLIEWRNRWVHGNVRFDLADFRKAISAVLGGLRPLHR